MSHLKVYQRMAEKGGSNFFKDRYGIQELNDVQLLFLANLLLIIREEEEEAQAKAEEKAKNSRYDNHYVIYNGD